MQAPIKHKTSAEPGKAPAVDDIILGELALNTYDGKLYFKKNDGTQSIVALSVDGHGHVKADVDGMPSGDVVGTTDTQTLTNKTLQDPAVDGGIAEQTATISGTSPDLSTQTGSIQLWALTGNSTPVDALDEGKSITLMISDPSGYTITWPAMTWINNGASAPSLSTTAFTVVVLWKHGGGLYGAFAGDGS